VAIKPSMGLVSRDRVIPILDSQDMVGPFTRNVIDLARVMDALVGTDPNDPVTAGARNRAAPFENGLNLDAVKGMRVGVVPVADPADAAAQSQMIDVLKVAGAEVVFLAQQPDPFVDMYGEDFFALGHYGFKAGIARYLAATNGPVKTAGEIAAFNLEDPADRIPYGQRQLAASAESTMTPAEYARRSLAIGESARAGLNKLMADNRLDLLAATGFGVFANFGYPVAGYPAITIPAGYRPTGEPIGFALVGNLFDDWKLVRAAYTLELISKMWRAPTL
jgi:amidase